MSDDSIGPQRGPSSVARIQAQVKQDRVALLEAENANLREALRGLYDEQFGPPSVRRESQWNAAINEAAAVLNGAECQLAAENAELRKQVDELREDAEVGRLVKKAVDDGHKISVDKCHTGEYSVDLCGMWWDKDLLKALRQAAEKGGA